MKSAREQIEKVRYLCRLRIQVAVRRLSPLHMIGLLFFLLWSLFFGIILVIGFLGILSQDGDFQPPFPYRDLLSFGFLIFFATSLSYLISTGATGLRNPYIRGRQDAHFFQRIPVDSSVMYLSTRLTGFLIVTTLVVPFVVVLFSPLMLVLHLPWWRVLGVLIVCLFTFNLCGNIADLSFIALRRFRRKGSWALIWLEPSSPIQAVIFLVVPGIAYLLIMQHTIPSFETLSYYILFPLINTAVAATGFFFRSGVPWKSWLALVFLISESVILAIITGIIAAKYRPMDDITDIMPVLSFIEVKISDIVGSKTIEPPELTNENLRGKTVFIGKPPWQAYVLKDWLTIRRIRALRRQIYLAPFVVTALTIAILFIIPKENPFYFMVFFFTIYPMAEFSLLLTQLEIKNPMQRFPVDRGEMGKSKFLLAVLVAGFYSIPLVVAKGPISLLIIFLVAGLSVIIGKTMWGPFKTRFILLLGIVFLVTPLLLWA